MSESVIVSCASCEVKTSAKILCSDERYCEEVGYPVRISLLKCAVCNEVMFSSSELLQVGHDKYEYGTESRLWPDPKEYLDSSIPQQVRDSLEEATTCLGAKAYVATVVMCGRAMEFLCINHEIKTKGLFKGLEELKQKGVIDGKLYEWGDSLREKRNKAAHASEENISRLDAQDILDFTKAICNYVYVLGDKYLKFKERQEKKKTT